MIMHFIAAIDQVNNKQTPEHLKKITDNENKNMKPETWKNKCQF